MERQVASRQEVKAQSGAASLKRILGLAFGLAVIVGTILGIGILRTPGLVAAQLGNPAIIITVWLLGGVYTLLGAVSLAELGTMLPQAGGYYVYARHAFGDSIGFAVGWTDWLTYCAVLGYVSIGIGEFSAVLVPSLAGFVPGVAILALVAFVGLQWAGLKVSSRFQEVATAIKFVAFLSVVVAALAYSHRATARGGLASTPSLTALVVALQSVVITYGGWQSALYFTEEDRNPSHNLPRSMIGGVVSVVVVYLLINLALLRVLSIADLAQSTLPAADAAQLLLGGQGRAVITILSLISLPPLLNAIMMIGTRILFAMGRDGLIWRAASDVTARGTPSTATIVTTVVAVGLIASGTFQKLVSIASFFLAANYCVSCLALFMLRWREPERDRPYRAWGYPWPAGIVLAGAGAFVVGTLAADPVNAGAAVALLAVGLIGRAAWRTRAAVGSRACP